jgi:triosephosphate isomerase
VCVGETTFFQNDHTEALSFVREQLHTSLAGISAEQTSSLIVAYEPVWAIGTGLAATPEIIRRIHAHIRAELSILFGAEGAAVPILYGGSTTPENIGGILAEPNVSGALVGSTSLKPEAFARLISEGRRAQGILRDQA